MKKFVLFFGLTLVMCVCIRYVSGSGTEKNER